MNSEQIEKKRQGEIRLISEMISLYCKKKHGSSEALCGECKALSDYAISRIACCPFMEKKEFLQLLLGALLFAGNAGEDSNGHADKRTEYAAPSSALIDFSCGRGNEK